MRTQKELAKSYRQKVNQAEKECMIQDILSVVPENLQLALKTGLSKMTKKELDKYWDQIYVKTSLPRKDANYG